MRPGVDRQAAFDDDYLYFYEELLTPERTAGEVDLIWKLLELEPGLELLDLARGHGRIANPLAERGVRVTGLDATPLFLELARADAAERGVDGEVRTRAHLVHLVRLLRRRRQPTSARGGIRGSEAGRPSCGRDEPPRQP